MKKLFTSESVTCGHPDKLCDQISDNILDAYLTLDPDSRVAVETFAHKDGITISGEITSTVSVDIENIVRKTINDIGYNNDKLLYNGNKITVDIHINKQSSDIALGVDNSYDTNKQGAGDQGRRTALSQSRSDHGSHQAPDPRPEKRG